MKPVWWDRSGELIKLGMSHWEAEGQAMAEFAWSAPPKHVFFPNTQWWVVYNYTNEGVLGSLWTPWAAITLTTGEVLPVMSLFTQDSFLKYAGLYLTNVNPATFWWDNIIFKATVAGDTTLAQRLHFFEGEQGMLQREVESTIKIFEAKLAEERAKRAIEAQ